MPSILSEIGFLSNPGDADYFNGEQARENVAEALFQGVSDYLRSLGALPGTEAVTAEHSTPR